MSALLSISVTVEALLTALATSPKLSTKVRVRIVNSGASALSHDGRLFALGYQNGQVGIYDTRTWKAVGEPVNCHSDWITGVAFSPDGRRRLATNGSGREPVRIWDLESRQQICTLPLEATGIHFLQFSADGRSLAFATPSRLARIVTVDLPK